MKAINGILFLIVFAAFSIGCQTVGSKAPRSPAGGTNERVGIRDTDSFRIRINQLQTLNLREKGVVFVSARLLVCVMAADESDICREVGTTDGIEMKANQSKDFRGETATSMPALYSRSFSGVEFNSIMGKLPPALANVTPTFKLELRRSTSKGPNATTIGFQRFNLPPIAAQPTDASKILQKQISMKADASRPGFEFGAELTLLFHRPK